MQGSEFRTVDVVTTDGVMATEIFYGPAGAPGVLFYMDARGVRDELRGMCRRLAEGGYTVLLPDLYYRQGRQLGFPSETSRGDAQEFETIVNLIKSTRISEVMSDTAALFDWIKRDPDTGIERYGVVGYCMGGPFAFGAASRFPDQVAAAASFYGVGCMADDPASPHHGVAKIRGELYFGYAEKDHLAPVSEIEPLGRLLDKAQVRHRIELYAGADHGFAFPRRKTYDTGADAKHWEALFDLFGRTLGSSRVA